MINVVLPGLVLSALLAAEPAASGAPAVPPPVVLPEIPPETVVLDLRRARIAGEMGDRARQKQILDALLTSHPADPTVLAAALAVERAIAPEGDAARVLRARLLDAVSQPGRTVPTALLRDIAGDPKSSNDDLERLLGLTAAQPGTGADRAAKMRVRVAALERLGRKVELLVALNDLIAIDSDPSLAQRLLEGYRDAGRWDDVLRATARIDAAQASVETGWWKLEALSGLGRQDELAAECKALIGRLRERVQPRLALAPARPAPTLPPYSVQRFFPYVFALYDSGRREAALDLVTELEVASLEIEDSNRLRVMLFGTPEERIAFLDSIAGASIASADPDKIRAEAYKRLLAKDYRTAHDLYGRLQELDASVSLLDGGDWFNYGLASIETEAWADVETAMTKAIDAGTSTPRALAHRARARITLGRIAEGMADAETALRLDPKLKQACYAMYLAYDKLGLQEKANEWLGRFKAP